MSQISILYYLLILKSFDNIIKDSCNNILTRVNYISFKDNGNLFTKRCPSARLGQFIGAVRYLSNAILGRTNCIRTFICISNLAALHFNKN